MPSNPASLASCRHSRERHPLRIRERPEVDRLLHAIILGRASTVVEHLGRGCLRLAQRADKPVVATVAASVDRSAARRLIPETTRSFPSRGLDVILGASFASRNRRSHGPDLYRIGNPKGTTGTRASTPGSDAAGQVLLYWECRNPFAHSCGVNVRPGMGDTTRCRSSRNSVRAMRSLSCPNRPSTITNSPTAWSSSPSRCRASSRPPSPCCCPPGAAYEPAELGGLGVDALRVDHPRGRRSRQPRTPDGARQPRASATARGPRPLHTSVSAATLGRNLIPALEIYADVLRRPHLDDEEVEPIRALALQNLQSLEDDPGIEGHLRAAAAPLPRPLGPPARRGRPKAVKALTPDDLRAFHQADYRPNGAILGRRRRDRLAGPARTPSAASSATGSRSPSRPSTVRPAGPRRDHILKETQQTQIALAYPTVDRRQPRLLPGPRHDRHPRRLLLGPALHRGPREARALLLGLRQLRGPEGPRRRPLLRRHLRPTGRRRPSTSPSPRSTGWAATGSTPRSSTRCGRA